MQSVRSKAKSALAARETVQNSILTSEGTLVDVCLLPVLRPGCRVSTACSRCGNETPCRTTQSTIMESCAFFIAGTCRGVHCRACGSCASARNVSCSIPSHTDMTFSAWSPEPPGRSPGLFCRGYTLFNQASATLNVLRLV